MDTNGYLKFRQGGAPLMRRVQGDHDIRLDGMVELLGRCRGATVFDIGCNKGKAGDECARNGATRVMGCDIDEACIWVAREWFADYRTVAHRFEVVDLTGGPEAMRKAFGKDAELKHDIILALAVVHKLKRIMPSKALSELITWFGSKTVKYFLWRGYGDDEIPMLDKSLGAAGLTRIHTSMISDIQPAAIWARK